MLLDELREGIFAHDEAKGWKRTKANLSEWTDAGIARRANVSLGSQVITDYTNRHRYVDRSAWEAPNYGCTNAELARAYMRHCRRLNSFGLPRGDMARHRLPWRKDQEGTLDAASAPLYYDGTSRAGEWAVVDIDRCYASLYVPVGLAPRFYHSAHQQRPLLALSTMRFDRPDEWVTAKGPRNALVGIALTKGDSIEYYDHGELQSKAAINDCYSPSLAAWCLFTARAIAQDLVRHFKFRTWATDGGIVRMDVAQKACNYLHNMWGLDASVRAHGEGYIWNATTWRMGNVETAQEVKVEGGPISLGEPLDVGWYRDTLRWAQEYQKEAA